MKNIFGSANVRVYACVLSLLGAGLCVVAEEFHGHKPLSHVPFGFFFVAAMAAVIGFMLAVRFYGVIEPRNSALLVLVVSGASVFYACWRVLQILVVEWGSV
jgi:hypothetical protein